MIPEEMIAEVIVLEVQTLATEVVANAAEVKMIAQDIKNLVMISEDDEAEVVVVVEAEEVEVEAMEIPASDVAEIEVHMIEQEKRIGQGVRPKIQEKTMGEINKSVQETIYVIEVDQFLLETVQVSLNLDRVMLPIVDHVGMDVCAIAIIVISAQVPQNRVKNVTSMKVQSCIQSSINHSKTICVLTILYQCLVAPAVLNPRGSRHVEKS